MGQLVQHVEAARDEGKYLILWDKQGSVSMFFKYKGQLTDWAPQQVKYAMDGHKDKTPVLELARKDVVRCLRNGENQLLDFDKMTPDLTNEWKDDAVFNAAFVFDRANFLQKDNYMKMVRDDENHGIGGLNPGHYIASDKWSLTLRISVESEDDLNKWLETVPHKENFKFLIIQ